MVKRFLGGSEAMPDWRTLAIPVDGLTVVLNSTPGARAEHLNLALVETTLLCVSNATLASVPPVILKRAAHEIRLLPSFNTRPDLQLLELQMLSQLLMYDARFEEDQPVPTPRFSSVRRPVGEEWQDTRPMLRS